MTATEAASFVFLDFFKISLPHPCTTASLKFSRFFQFFLTWRKAGRTRKRDTMTDFNLKQTQISTKLHKCDPALREDRCFRPYLTEHGCDMPVTISDLGQCYFLKRSLDNWSWHIPSTDELNVSILITKFLNLKWPLVSDDKKAESEFLSDSIEVF